MRRYKATILYHDHRTGEEWTDTEYCVAMSLEEATTIFRTRISHGEGTELVGVDPV